MPTIMKNGVPTYVSVAEYNEELKKTRKDVLGIDEETGKLKHKKVENLGKIWVNGQEFSGMAYQGLLTVNTKTYVDEPTRSNDGSIPNINDYDTFIVPRCKVNFKYFNIEDYQRLCDAIQSNEFVVKYYDKQFDQFVSHKMYCEPEEMAKLYNVGTDVFGVLDYEISFIGTLNDLDTLMVTYQSNGGTIKGNPQQYTSDATYNKGDRVYLVDTKNPDDTSKYRYFEAIYYNNSFKPTDDSGNVVIELGNATYWLQRTFYAYSSSQSFSKNNIGYEKVYNDNGEEIGRNYYIAIYNGTFSGIPFTDSLYWKKISVSEYSNTKTYSSNKTSADDETYGQFVINSEATAIYEAIYYTDTFTGVYPTTTSYWSALPLGVGIQVKWGNSIVVADPEDLFDLPSGYNYADSWGTKDGSTLRDDGTQDYGFMYIEGQSLNVFKNLTLYAIWKTGEN